MRLILIGSLVAAASCTTTTSTLQPPHQPSTILTPSSMTVAFDAAALRATLIFEGVVLIRDSSMVSLLSSAPNTIVVQVGQVFRTTEEISDFGGRLVTVVVRDTLALAVGTHVVFFTYGLLLGDGMAVQEVLRVPVTTLDSVRAVRARLVAADSVNADRAMRTQADSSNAVVLGVVDSTAAVVVSDSASRLMTERTPRWARAAFHVTSVFGSTDTALINARISILFANGGDVFEETAPHLSESGQYILWLRKASRLPPFFRIGIDTTNRYFVLTSRDLRPASDTARVRQALRIAVGGRPSPLGPRRSW